MSDAAIPLSFQSPQIDTLQNAQQRRLGLQGMATAQAINEQRLQEERMKADQLEEDRRDQATVRDTYSKYVPKEPGKKIDYEALRNDLATKVTPRTLQNFDKSWTEHATAMAKLTGEQIATRKSIEEQLAKHLDAVAAIKPGDTSPEATAARAAEWAKRTTLAKANGLDPDNLLNPTEYPGDDQLPILDIGLRGSVAHLTEEEQRRKGLQSEQMMPLDLEAKRAATSKAKTEADNAARAAAIQSLTAIIDPSTGVPDSAQLQVWQSKYPGVLPENATPTRESIRQLISSAVPVSSQPEYNIKSLQANQMASMKPEDWDQLVDASVPASGDSAKLNQRTKALVRGAIKMGLPLSAVQAVVKDAADQIGKTETAVRTAEATKPMKIEVAASTSAARAPQVGQEGLDMMAESALSGQPPSSRNPILYARVMQRAAEMAKERGLTAQGAIMERNAAQANKHAFDAVTKQYETLKPFAEMAEKNANVLEKKSALVSDLGASFWNTPLRELQGKFTGNTNVAAFKAALLPVQADFARILNSPTGSGVLSDTARAEMSHVLKEGATPGEIKAALDVFRTDAQQRKDAYEEQLRTLKQRTVVGGGGTLPDGGGKRIDKETARRFYAAAGNDPKKAEELAKKNNWKVD